MGLYAECDNCRARIAARVRPDCDRFVLPSGWTFASMVAAGAGVGTRDPAPVAVACSERCMTMLHDAKAGVLSPLASIRRAPSPPLPPGVRR